jgi:hypothetical protein
MEEKNSICSVIRSLTKKYEKSIEGRKVNVRELKVSGKIFSLDLDKFAHLTNHVLQIMQADKISGLDRKAEYLENIFQMLGLTKTACTGKINLKYHLKYYGTLEEFQRVYENSFSSSFVNIDYPKALTNMSANYIQDSIDIDIDIDTKLIIDINSRKGDMNLQALAIEFYNRLEGSVCKYDNFTFNSIALINDSNIYYYMGEWDKFKNYFNNRHANILLVMKNNRDIKFFLYEPHGSEVQENQIKLVQKSGRIFIELFRGALQAIYDMKGTPCNIQIMDSIYVSCPKGIQVYVDDNLGYCKLISTLWLYLVLGLFSSKDISTDLKIQLFENLQVVETCLYDIYRDPKELYNVVVNFSIDILNNYLVFIATEDLVRKFHNKMLQKIKDMKLVAGVNRHAMEALEQQEMYQADTHPGKDDFFIF